MTSIYKLEFRPCAAKAFHKLDHSLKQQLAKKLDQRRRGPRVPGDKLRDMPECYKIKLRSSGLRVIYQVQDDRLVILVLAIAKREREEAYQLASAELKKL